ncbi:HTH-like domain-containing protein [Burkholderia sp. b14]|nr:HTH-like domain-containing protein [Burkholderia sp. b14]
MKQVCEVLGVARFNVVTKLSRPAQWRDGRRWRRMDDGALVEEIRLVVAELPSYGYRRVWGILRRERCGAGLAPVNAKRVYRVMRTHALLMQQRPQLSRAQRRRAGEAMLE